MSSRARRASNPRARASGRQSKRWQSRWLALGAGAVAVLTIGGVLIVWRGNDAPTPSAPGTGAALSSLNTPDFHSLAISPQDPSLLLYGHHGGVLRSTDGGRTWNKTNLTDETDDAMGMGFSSSDGREMFAAGHDTFFRSGDAGANWEDLRPDLPGTDIHGMTTAPDRPGRIYAHVVRYGLYRSDDGGERWSKANTTELPGDVMALSAGPGGRLYAAAPSRGVLRSDDGGTTFRRMGNIGGAVAIAASGSDPDAVYVGTQSGLFSSTDGGETWTPRPLPIDGGVMVSAVNPTDALDVVVVVVDDSSTGHVFRSADGGQNWGPR